MASAEHEFAYRKLTALTGCQWFTEESSLQCKLEVTECTGRTFCGEDVRGMLIYLPAFSKVLFFYQVGCEYLYHNNN